MTDYEPPSLRTTLIATAIAAGVALVLLFLVILPAEYGIDPTGAGGLLGLTSLSEEAPPEPDVPPLVQETVTFSRFNVSFPESQRLLGKQTGSLEAGATEALTFEVPQANVTRFTAILSWTDDEVAGRPTDPDTFDLAITSPTGETRTWTGRNEERAATLQAPFVLGQAPRARTIEATDEAAATQAAMDAEPASLLGTGTWTIELTLREAGGLGPVEDEGNDWSLQVFVTDHQLLLGEPEPTDRRQDTVQITVPAGTGVEYKVRMQEGDGFHYAWSAPIAMYYDFHGIRADTTETSHEEATAASRSDDFVAPFSGRHGWYWQNESLQDVTVSLELDGVYQVLE